MFKNFLKSRHGAREQWKLRRKEMEEFGNKDSAYYGEYKAPTNDSPSYSLDPVDYNRSGPSDGGISSEYSIAPVEYRHSPMGPQQSATKTTSAFSVAPVQYNHSPFSSTAAGVPKASATQSPTPVDYPASAPLPIAKQVAQLNAPRIVQQPSRYTYTVDHPPPPSPAQQQYAYNAPHTHHVPVELPASAVPPRYELPAANSPRYAPAPPYPQQPAQHSPNPSIASSSSTLVPSPRAEVPSPPLGYTKASSKADDNDLIKKFVVDIYCPLKRDAHGNRREQIPRDVREFRLAKVALIPIVAGKRTFLSFDVVFGEADKMYADIVEKHFSCSNKTRLDTVETGTVQGGEVHAVGPLNIAYRDGESSTVYVKFSTPEDKAKFQAAFWDMWVYVEQ